MKLEFTPALQLAFDRARRQAALESASQVEPRHFLRGILAEEEGIGVGLLVDAGADWPRLQQHLGLPMPDEPADALPMSLHPSCQGILQAAGELARLHGDEGSVKTDHVLLALITREGELRRELEGFGMQFDRMRQSIVGDTSPLVMDEPLQTNQPIEEVHTARILDVNANRTREALRVLEDYARFVLNDAFLSAQLKQLRHDFAEALTLLPASLLIDARDTANDVGTTISTEQEWQRSSLFAVVQANAKRLQEGLRSLEEFGKVVEAAFAQQIEKIRYQTYTLERALVQGAGSRDRLADVQLCVLVAEKLCRFSLAGTVKEAILGGAQMIQLREKHLEDRELLAQARDLRRLTEANNVLFIVNDRPDIARLAGADGVHLGQEDLSVQEARQILGADALVGVSTHSVEQVRRAVLDGANYIGVGPTFPSETKTFTEFAGLDFVKQALQETSLPAFAIGGVNPTNIALVRVAGAHRVAVSHAVCAAEDPRAVGRALREALA